MRPKVFGVGHNKTGTTSLAVALRTWGYTIGDQFVGEGLIGDWSEGRYDRIVSLADTADSFLDMPFSLSGTYVALEAAFPQAKFILTVRGSTKEWYRSLVGAHSKAIGKGTLPTIAELETHGGRPGWILEAMQLIYGTEPDDLYNEQALSRYYEAHNAAAKAHFARRDANFLCVDLSLPSATVEVLSFLGLPTDLEPIPHLNRSGC